jgi:hypothetical protein
MYDITGACESIKSACLQKKLLLVKSNAHTYFCIFRDTQGWYRTPKYLNRKSDLWGHVFATEYFGGLAREVYLRPIVGRVAVV